MIDEDREIAREKKNHARVTEEGKRLGAQLVRLANIGMAKLKKDDGKEDSRCKTCAFRTGTVPNGCPQTTLDAYKCVMEGKIPFKCHCKVNGELPICDGWVAARAGMREKGIQDREVPFKFLHEYEEK